MNEVVTTLDLAEEGVMTREEVCDFLKVSGRTLDRLVEKGQIATCKTALLRYSKVSVKRYAASKMRSSEAVG